MNRSAFILILLCIACTPDQGKSNATEQNNDKFSNHDQKEAQFVVDLVDTSYGLLNVAQLGEDKVQDSVQKHQLQDFIQTHTSALMKLKAFAESKGIAIPYDGPGKGGKTLRKIEGADNERFEKTWMKELKRLQHKIYTDLEGYRNNSNDSMINPVLDSTLIMVRENNGILETLEKESKSI
jgi:hypothetical protein